MNIFDRLFRNRRKHPRSPDDVNVSLHTQQPFTEEQKSAIIAIVKNGVVNDLELHDIAINIMICLGIHLSISISIDDNGTDVDVRI